MRLLLAALLSVAAAPAFAGQGAPACVPVVVDGWVRLAPGMPMGAAFGTIRNPCPASVEITGVASPDFADTSLHETRLDGGISRMRAVPRLVVPAGRTVALRPGGLHAMLMKPRRDLAPGAKVRVEFLLRDGRRLAADLPVRSAAP